jgi:lipopolysaccharide transport system ATP-binding protein
MSSRRPAISVSGLSKRYDVYAQPVDRLRRMVFGRLRRMVGLTPGVYSQEFWALHPLSFEVRRGDTVGIIGRNGSGKSTLLQLVCGTLTPTSGQVSADGRIAALLELGAGFNADFSGEENIRLSGLIYGLSEDQIRTRFQSIVDFSELGDFIQQPVKTYSSGMYVRLAFSIAAHVDADILIVDEALSVGDVRFSQKCARFLRDFQSRGTLLFVSHDLSAVINLCSRAIWLERGRIMEDGPAKEVVEAYLAEQHAQDRAAVGAKVVADRPKTAAATPTEPPEPDDADQRHQSLIKLGLRPKVKVFSFDPESTGAAFGERRVEIEDVRLEAVDSQGRAFLCGELVELIVEARASAAVESIIFGFYVKDRLGQRLFGDNSYLTFLTEPPSAGAGERLAARFRFRMPVMPAGEYTVDVAVATGSQLEHTQQHWLHDALTFRSDDTTMRHGLVGIPVSVAIETLSATSAANGAG